MTTSSQTTAQSTKIRRFPPAGQTCWQSMRWATFSLVFSLQSPVSGCLCLSQCRDRWGHNRLVSISHIRVIIVKWDNDLVLRWHLFIFLNFAVLIFQETHIKHTTHGEKHSRKRERSEKKEPRNTCTYALLGSVARPALVMIISEPWKSTASIWLYCQCNGTSGRRSARFDSTRMRIAFWQFASGGQSINDRGDSTKHETPAN